MKVTVCQLNNEHDVLIEEWQRLVEHVASTASELVLLPEMPFAAWVASQPNFESAAWNRAVVEHERWLERFSELAPAKVCSTRPVNRRGARHNEGFVWDAQSGYLAVHSKYYLPNEAAFWEANWYDRGDFDFSLGECDGVRIGFLICTEMWFTEHARAYAKEGVHLLLCPRATPMASQEKWLAGGRAAAVMAGAYVLSSNRGGRDRSGMEWAGQGWIIEPEEGDVLVLTTEDTPFVTQDIDLAVAEQAKRTYPRYVRE